MKYAYEDLGEHQFEQLVVLLCQRLLGRATQGFAKGIDGGRDARFVGTAQLLPSERAPWVGTVIVQAKHTNGYNRSFSESAFFSLKSEKTTMGEEMARIRRLREARQLDHYLLFANRKLTGNTESDIRLSIANSCNLQESSILLCGLEQLEMWLKAFPDVPAAARLDPLDSPLIVSPDDLSEVVQAFARHLNGAAMALDAPPTPRIPFETKNAVNNMSADYAKGLRRLYLKETSLVKDFLADPENSGLLRMYESVVEEFQLRIIARRKDYHSFDDVMNYLFDLLIARDPLLRANKRLTRIMLFYMYWNCDIGESADVAAV
jgi:hypothetical protein